MFKVKKGNRVLTVNETEKSYYLSEGYDVVELNEETKDYEVAEKATGGRTYSVAEYNAVADELARLKGIGLKVKDTEEFKKLQAENDDLKEQLEKVSKDPERDAIIAKLKEKGISYNGNSKTENLQKLLEENA